MIAVTPGEVIRSTVEAANGTERGRHAVSSVESLAGGTVTPDPRETDGANRDVSGRPVGRRRILDGPWGCKVQMASTVRG